MKDMDYNEKKPNLPDKYPSIYSEALKMFVDNFEDTMIEGFPKIVNVMRRGEFIVLLRGKMDGLRYFIYKYDTDTPDKRRYGDKRIKALTIAIKGLWDGLNETLKEYYMPDVYKFWNNNIGTHIEKESYTQETDSDK